MADENCLREGLTQSHKSEDGFSSFLSFFKIFINEPFGSRLFESLHDLINELELSEEFFSHLKKVNAKKLESMGVSGRSSVRKHQRKPCTPSKVIKNATTIKGTTLTQESGAQEGKTF